ncbi:SH3 domain-containing protein [Breoghania sp. L-A4]|uniref:SH3 domain-containing protein n=1 Tax=Breoghania sp. L-A4 TaxID=2304600 RepID=UPI000E357FC0|nr:SH3 domain-containing protein [Breoghania sp. L-A4]AXS38820.1 aspartyl-trna synthetase [Breoghania sp. L-A4]
MKDLVVNRRRFAFLAGLCAMAALFAGDALAQGTQSGASGLPVPRFVSLKSDRVNVRRGPGRDHEIIWTYVRAGLPVEIVQEFENWRRIRDWEGGEGWVFHSLLSGRRTALIKPWEKSGTTPLRSNPDSNAPVVAQLEPNVVASVTECGSGFCRIAGSNWSGWVDQTLLFGVYPDETFD